MADLSLLSDAELSQMLKNYGVDVGPINVATRRTYERRLAKLQTEEPAPASPVVNNVDVDQSVDEEEVNVSLVKLETSIYTADVATSPYHHSDDEKENSNISTTLNLPVKEVYIERSVKNTIVTNSSRPEHYKAPEQISREKHEDRSVKPTVVITPARLWPENDREETQVKHPEPAGRQTPVLSKIPQPVMSSAREREFSSRIESRPSLPLNRRTPVPRATPVTSYTAHSTPSRPVLTRQPQEKKKEYPIWLPVVIIGLAVILGYLIYANMEPAARSNIPDVSNKIEV